MVGEKEKVEAKLPHEGDSITGGSVVLMMPAALETKELL